MEKRFISFEKLRADWIKLFDQIYFNDKFVPDVIYAALRGGSFGANILSELYKLVLPKDHKPVLFGGVVAHSYSDYEIGTASRVRIDGWTYSPDWLRPGDKILLVDDLWDSGRTLIALEKELLSRGLERKNLKVAVHDYKVRNDVSGPSVTAYIPDYKTNIIQVNSPEENPWIHYEIHELVGLNEEERKQLYMDFSGDCPTVIDSKLKEVIDKCFAEKE
jgi:hypothetical protein